MTVAEAVAPLVRAAVGREAPVEIRGCDGSRIGPPNAQWALKINNRRGLRRLLWARSMDKVSRLAVRQEDGALPCACRWREEASGSRLADRRLTW